MTPENLPSQLPARRASSFAHHTSESTARSCHLQTAGSVGVDVSNISEARVLVCSNRRKKCEACPSLQTFRKLVATEAELSEWLVAFPSHVQADAGDRDGECAQIHHSHDQTRFRPIGKERPRGCHAELYSIAGPCAPEVHHTERSAQQRDPQGYSFEGGFVHAAEIKARRALLIWAAVVLLALLLAATPFVLDGPDEFEAATDTSATVADAIADAQRVARFERVSP